MCMKPLLRNITANDQIRAISSKIQQQALPKTCSYADDVNATIQDSTNGMQALFSENENLPKSSGLELNMDKTEILQRVSNAESSHNIMYTN